MPAALDPIRLYEAPPGHPTAAQRAAVDRAERRACELLPALETPLWRWAHAPNADVNGVARPYPRCSVVYLRDDRTAAQTYATALHELMHVYDREWILDHRISHEESERRARRFAALVLQGGEDPMNPAYHRLAYQLIAEGLVHRAAFDRVNRMSEAATLDALAARGSTPTFHVAGPAGIARNGHGDGRCLVCGDLMAPSPRFPDSPLRECRGCGRGRVAS
jgi:hypothetical protein